MDQISEQAASPISEHLMREVRLAELAITPIEFALKNIPKGLREKWTFNEAGWFDPDTGNEGGTFELYCQWLGVAVDGDAARRFILWIDPAAFDRALDQIPIETMGRVEMDYVEYTKQASKLSFPLAQWLPALRDVRLVPGELACVIADTGVGKSCVLQSICMAASPLPCLLFELELPKTLMFERFVQMNMSLSSAQVTAAYESGTPPSWRETDKLNHLYICDRLMTCEQIEKAIAGMALLHKVKPVIVVVDYIGLVGGTGERYERVSNTAEAMKAIAKRQNVIIVMASQMNRVSTDGPPHLHSGKDSGAVENSSGLVLGLWRDGDNNQIMRVKILKNTKGQAGQEVACDFDVRTMRITQRTNLPSPAANQKKKGGPYAD